MKDETKKLFDNVRKLFEGAAKKWAKTNQGRTAIEDISLYDGYADDPETEQVIATGNWNVINHWDGNKLVTDDDVMKRLGDALENMGVEIEWSDQHTSCDECNKLIRTEPDSYFWKPKFADTDGCTVCEACLGEDPEEHLKSLEGDATKFNTFDSIDPAEHGYVLVEDGFESGLHEGMDANPKLVAKALEDQGITRFLFQCDDPSQFYTKWSVYVHEDEIELLDREKFAAVEKDGPSNAARLKKQLQEGAVAADALQGEGVRLMTLNADGTVNARVVPPEEFIAGVKK